MPTVLGLKSYGAGPSWQGASCVQECRTTRTQSHLGGSPGAQGTSSPCLPLLPSSLTGKLHNKAEPKAALHIDDPMHRG